LPVLAQAFDQRIAARFWQARVDHFDHDVDELHGPLHFLAGLVHVTGKPLDCHNILHRHKSFEIDWEQMNTPAVESGDFALRL
jgi:hypothetical protein